MSTKIDATNVAELVLRAQEAARRAAAERAAEMARQARLVAAQEAKQAPRVEKTKFDGTQPSEKVEMSGKPAEAPKTGGELQAYKIACCDLRESARAAGKRLTAGEAREVVDARFGEWVKQAGKQLDEGADPDSIRKSFAKAADIANDTNPTRLVQELLGASKPTTAKKSPTPSKKYVNYTVKSGDTFSSIAAKHKLSVSALSKLNPQVKDVDVIYAGQKLHVKVVKSPQPQPQPQPADDVLPKGIPNTAGMSEAKEYALYSRYVEKHGDARAKADLAAGRRVVVGLRMNTPFTSDRPYRGSYDDRIVVLWKDSSGRRRVAEFAANTEPNRRWADDPSQRTKPVGRLVGNKTYHYKKSYSANFGGKILAPDLRFGNPTVRRDTNRNHRIDSNDKVYDGDWGGQVYYFHRGGVGDTYSAGCQTMDQGRFNSFWDALGPQSEFSYVLANVG